jgi:benzoyl-CoA reductase/2-hydroxyglutaryl-CoA dehydratase subunit BcrC/BadD/HgdB
MNTENMSAKEMLVYYQELLDEEAREAKRNKQPVCWSSSVAPSEMCVAMGVPLVYPETHAAGIGARKGALDMLEHAEQQGYSLDICSYARINLAYMDMLKEKALTGKASGKLANSPAADVPLPDLIITCNNICNTVLKWYENLASELEIPCIIIDVPFNHSMPVSEHARDYIVGQINYAIRQLEEICGRPFDYDKFLEAQIQTQRSVAQWNRVAEFMHDKPTPLNGFDLYNFMALIVCARSREYAEKTFRAFADELDARKARGEFPFGENQKLRISSEGIAVWPHLAHAFKTLRAMGVIMTGSSYPDTWNLVYEPGDLRGMAEAYSKTYMNTCLENRARVLTDIVKNGQCDGLLLHLNRSCKLMSFLNNESAEIIQEETGVPYVSYDGDQTDPRNFSPAQFDTRVQALGEMMAVQEGKS